MVEFVCIGVPYQLGEPALDGNAIELIRQSGIAEAIGAEWVDIKPDFAAASDPITAVNRALITALQANSTKFPLIFVGDCTTCIGVYKAFETQSPLVLWLDAHGDFNTHETSPSHFLGGMPLAALVGRDNQPWLQGVDLTPIAETNVIVSDGRDLDPQESINLRASDVTLIPDFNDLLTMPLPDKPIYVHFDMDAMTLADMPAVGYPAQGGPTLAETTAVLRRILHDGDVVCVLFTLWTATLPGADVSRQSTLDVVRAIAAELNA